MIAQIRLCHRKRCHLDELGLFSIESGRRSDVTEHTSEIATCQYVLLTIFRVGVWSVSRSEARPRGDEAIIKANPQIGSVGKKMAV